MNIKNIKYIEGDMYGDVVCGKERRKSQIEQLGNKSIPYNFIEDAEYMSIIRKYYTLNISLPACIETENPNRFIKNLRPVELFRNTPVIPVTDLEISRWKQRIQQYHQNVFFFEVNKSTLFNYRINLDISIIHIIYIIYILYSYLVIFCIIIYAGLFLVKVALDKQDEMGIAY